MARRNDLQGEWIRPSRDIVIGILGSGVRSWLLERVFKVSLGEGWIGSILTGAIGAIVILFLVNLIFRKKK